MSFKGFTSLSSHSHFYSAEQNQISTLEEGHPRNISVNFFFKLSHSPRRRYCFKVFSAFSSSSGGHFVHQGQTILAILVKGLPRNIWLIFFLN